MSPSFRQYRDQVVIRTRAWMAFFLKDLLQQHDTVKVEETLANVGPIFGSRARMFSAWLETPLIAFGRHCRLGSVSTNIPLTKQLLREREAVVSHRATAFES